MCTSVPRKRYLEVIHGFKAVASYLTSVVACRPSRTSLRLVSGKEGLKPSLIEWGLIHHGAGKTI
jgi:hypothetical protein